MRPVNLIPKDERRGDRAAMRTGVASYVLLGALVMAVLAVAVLALTSKQISDHKSEIRAASGPGGRRPVAKAQEPPVLHHFQSGSGGSFGHDHEPCPEPLDWQRVLNEFRASDPVQRLAHQACRDSGPHRHGDGWAGPPDAGRGDWSRPRDGGLRVQPGCRRRPDRESPGDRRRHPRRPGVVRAAGCDPGHRQRRSYDLDSNATTTDCRTRDFITQFKILVAFDEVPTPATASSTPPSHRASRRPGAPNSPRVRHGG